MENGSLERGMNTSGWPVPGWVELEATGEHFTYGDLSGKVGSPHTGLLAQFVKLKDADSTSILRFVRENGILGMADDEDPLIIQQQEETSRRIVKRRFGPLSIQLLDPPGRYEVVDQEYTYGRESIRVWKYWSEQFSRALNVAARLRRGEIPELDAWPTITSVSGDLTVKWLTRSAAELPKKRFGTENLSTPPDSLLNSLILEIRAWMITARIALTPNVEQRRLEIYTPYLFSGLVLQVMSAILASSGFAVCSACSGPYAPKRQPSKNRRNYCDDCKPKAHRDAVREYDERQRTLRGVK